MSLKSLIMKSWTAVFHSLYWHKGRSIVVFSDIKGVKNNELQAEQCWVKKSHLAFSGEGNSIQLKECEIFHCNILLRGKGHRLIIEEGVHLHNMWIKIIGEGNTVHIGANTSFGSGHLISGGKGTCISVGRECMIADGVDIWSTDTHSVLQDGKLVNKPESIIIGDHVWIGKDVAILKGVTIGDNAVVGMRSMVTKDVPPATLNVGSPARVIREGIDWNRCNPNNE